MGPLPQVSVIIPCFNGAEHLSQAIQSGLDQTYPNVEIVVVDDGSTDDSASLAEEFGERIKLVRQPNSGLSAARNAGIRCAAGEFIVLLDADDVLLPGCVELRLAPALADGEVGLVAGYYREIDERGAVLTRVPEVRRLTGQSHFYQAVRRNWGPPAGWLIRRRAIELCGGFDPFLKSCEDWDLLLRVMTRFKLAYVPEVTAYYRQVPGQMSRNHLVMYDAASKVLVKNHAYAPNKIGYWWWSLFGRFQHGRRIIYNVLTERPKQGRIARLGRLVLRRPALLWIGALSLVSLLLGKRHTMS